MSAFDPQTVLQRARAGSAPSDWEVLHLNRSAAQWDLFARLAAGLVLLVVCVLLAVNATAGGEGAAPFVFAAFALLAAIAYLTAGWSPLMQVRRPENYLLVVAVDGVALDWAGRVEGLPFVALADVSLRRRSFRAIFGKDLILTQADGTEVVLPIGELFGEPSDLLTTVITRTRLARGLPATAE